MQICQSIIETIGNTPLVKISGIANQKANLLVKPELFNPGGSVKDRTALSMIEDAERRGILQPGATIIEPTSGNTGVGLAWVGAVKGYKIILTMPDNMSAERCSLLRAYGAQIILTPGELGMAGSISRAHELQNEIQGSVILEQFSNPSNPLIHEQTTGEEIWRDTDGKIDVFVAGVGTGGTLVGTARALKAHNASISIIAVEPANSAVLSGGEKGPHQIQGIGAGFVPSIYDPAVVDEVCMVKDQDAITGARTLARRYGILAGISSGAVFSVCSQLACSEEWRDKTIVALLPDTGERYLSTQIFD